MTRFLDLLAAFIALLAAVAFIALVAYIRLFVILWQPEPIAPTWAAVMACEDVAGARMPRAEAVRVRRWYFVQDSRFQCRAYWGYGGGWERVSVLGERSFIESETKK